jgi:pimeloyl-ACP methyl ester carboxylesterase
VGSPLSLVLVPGLLCSAPVYGPQIEALWPHGPVTIADHRRDNEIGALAARILAAAAPRFALVGLSFGGYIALAMMRQAPERIDRLALLDTSARPDTPEQCAARHAFIAMAEDGRFGEVVDTLALRYLHRDRHKDVRLRNIVRAMAADTGPEAFIRQQQATMSRPDSRPRLGDIRCPTLVLGGDSDELTPPDLSREIAAGIPGSKLVIVPACGHLSTIERPEAVNAALAEWLSG